ncbi:hypothetical protein Tco_0460220 [Tanacetum coccineum]
MLRSFSLFLLALAASEVFGADTGPDEDTGSSCGLVSIGDYIPYAVTDEVGGIGSASDIFWSWKDFE